MGEKMHSLLCFATQFCDNIVNNTEEEPLKELLCPFSR